MKCLMLVGFFPLPVIGGRDRMVCQHLSFLKRMGIEVDVICIAKKKNATFDDRNSLASSWSIFDRPSVASSMLHFISSIFKLKPISMQEAAIYSPLVYQYVNANIKKYDVIFCHTIRTVDLIPNSYKGKKIIDLDDLYSERYKQLAQVDDVQILGSEIGNFPLFVQKISKKFRYSILRWEYHLVKHKENISAKKFNCTFLVSATEAEQLRLRTSINTVYDFPPSKSMPKGNKWIDFSQRQGHRILFLGNLSVDHNRIGIIHFLKNIFPLIQRKVVDSTVDIVGSDPSPELTKLAKANPGIHLRGFVEDLDAYLLNASLAIQPLYHGTGIKTKAIEAMAVGLPIVSTTWGITGLSVQHNQELLIANDDFEFSESVCKLLEDKDFALLISDRSFQFAEALYSTDAVYNKYSRIISSVVLSGPELGG